MYKTVKAHIPDILVNYCIVFEHDCCNFLLTLKVGRKLVLFCGVTIVNIGQKVSSLRICVMEHEDFVKHL